MEHEKQLEKCILYFKAHEGFQRVFSKMKDKYKSLGTIGGTIQVTNLSEKEKDALSGFLRKDYTKQKSAIIKVDTFQKALERTRFAGLKLEDILEKYFESQLLSNKETANMYLERRDLFFNSIIKRYEDTPAARWLDNNYREKCGCYVILVKRYDLGREKVLKDIDITCKAINRLPLEKKKKIPLAVFAAEISKNPHQFDENTDCGQLFQYALMHRLNIKKPQNAEEKAELFFQAGILKDEISNFTVCCGLKAYKENSVHEGWGGYYNNKEPMQVSLINLTSITRIISPTGKIFVFENPSVFSEVYYRCKEYYPPMLCSYGQVKIASLVLLDMLVKEGTIIFYSGDFDPEGLLIADRLKQRYKAQLVLWRYDKDSYLKSRSHQIINSARLNKMRNIKDEQLQAMAAILKDETHAGYQEMMIDLLTEDVKTSLEHSNVNITKD
ncbi:TIGR02679 family protein [Petroclostridium sp. X23]|uniref:TIGR02679 family protein n=1 Tax=Petroclostridium sp. X23 TaxID=3045146 RepID=UPI0024ADEF2C|nr:TIGR02679 family protein [Petroclostridium sp. X23]WHH59493.1 TIGR02679 family protein [Petroclostridium sp. X23]